MGLYYAAIDTNKDYGYNLNDPNNGPPVLSEFETKYKVTWKKASKGTRKKRVDDYAGSMIRQKGPSKPKGIEASPPSFTGFGFANKNPDGNDSFGDGFLTKIGKIAAHNAVAVAGLIHEVKVLDGRVDGVEAKQQADVNRLQEQINKLKL